MYRTGLSDTDVPPSNPHHLVPDAPSDATPAASATPPAPPPSSAPHARPPHLIDTLRAAPVTSLIIAVNVVVFLLASRTGRATEPETLIQFGAVFRPLVWQGQYWRLVTSMFLHIGVIHLVWNAYYGFRLSARVERAIGAPRFLMLYLMTGVAGSAASVIGHYAVAAGASGALFGLIGWDIGTLRARLGSFRAIWEKPELRSQLTMVGAWFVLGAFAGFDNYAHAGGLVFGLLFTWALLAPPGRRRFRIGVVLLSFVGLVGLSLRPLPLIHAKELARFHAPPAPSNLDD